jgi:probable DNA metabolism protein
MQTLVYDNSFAGWLSAVFAVYEYKYSDVHIIPLRNPQPGLFANYLEIPTDTAKAARAWKGLQQRVSAAAAAQVHHAFLSEIPGVENQLLQYCRYAFSKSYSIETDFGNPAVRFVNETARKVQREKHRMEAFVRFRQTQDGLYMAVIEPDFNVLPLIQPHFEQRYADQRWLIFDRKRNYGLYYNLQETQGVELATGQAEAAAAPLLLHESEEMYEDLWRHYFSRVNIPERKNMVLHLRHMPRRYWKYLPEKRKT